MISSHHQNKPEAAKFPDQDENNRSSSESLNVLTVLISLDNCLELRIFRIWRISIQIFSEKYIHYTYFIYIVICIYSFRYCNICSCVFISVSWQVREISDSTFLTHWPKMWSNSEGRGEWGGNSIFDIWYLYKSTPISVISVRYIYILQIIFQTIRQTSLYFCSRHALKQTFRTRVWLLTKSSISTLMWLIIQIFCLRRLKNSICLTGSPYRWIEQNIIW